MNLIKTNSTTCPVIGMLHSPSLPGSPLAKLNVNEIIQRVVADAEALKQGGVAGLMLENFGDTPFFPDRVPTEVATIMTRLAGDVRSRVDLPLGINVLRNDGETALAVAVAAGAEYIRVNVLCGARVTDQGVINGVAARLLRLRKQLDAEHIAIWADVDVKHSQPLGNYSLEDDVRDTAKRGHADAIIVSGKATGSAVENGELQHVKSIATPCPILVGSGVDESNVKELARFADGLIVGSSIKTSDDIFSPVDPTKVERLLKAMS